MPPKAARTVTVIGRVIDNHIIVDRGIADNRMITITSPDGAFRAEYTRRNSDYYIRTITGEWIDVSPIRDHEHIDMVFYAYLEARGEQW